MGPFPRGQALVIGVGAHGDERWDAPTAARDAQGLYDTLIGSGGYGPGQAELLLDGAATRDGALAALRRLANRSAADSVALISLTCHGAQGEQGLYTLATSGAAFTADGRIAHGSGLTIADLARALRDIPARHMLLLVNACYAGHLGGELGLKGIAPEFAGRATGEPLTDEAGNQILATGEGRAILTASRPGQLSYFKLDEQHSYFGQALIDALRGSATSAADGVIGLYELAQEVYRQVRDVTERRIGVAQEPVLTVIQSAGPFPVASSLGPGRGALAAGPAGDLPVRVVPQSVAQAIGHGATAINAGAGSTVTVDNSKLIDFGGATVMGGVTIGDVAGGDIIKVNSPSGAADAADRPPDPLRDLPLLRERVAVARNVDEDSRDEAASKLDLAHKALARGDSARAGQRVAEALDLLRPMNNGYINSVVRKLEALQQAL